MNTRTTKAHRLEENLGAAGVELPRSDIEEIQGVVGHIAVHGYRYGAASQRMVDR